MAVEKTERKKEKGIIKCVGRSKQDSALAVAAAAMFTEAMNHGVSFAFINCLPWWVIYNLPA